jgi:hypothetical protein
VCLFSSGGGYGVWAGIELFHTPVGQLTWGLGVQTGKAGEFSPWHCHASEEEGFWQDSGDFVIEHVSTGTLCTLVPAWQQLVDAFDAVASSGLRIHPVMQSMLGQVHEIIEKRQDGMIGLLCPDGFIRFFPPAVCIPSLEDAPVVALASEEPLLPPPPPPYDETVLPQARDDELTHPPPEQLPPVEHPSATVEQAAVVMPSSREQGLTFECWSIAAEKDLEQIERVVSQLVSALQADGVVLPENIRMVCPCKEDKHNRCFVYRFGTRRLHFATRSTDDGRVTLVVRCGGGFMDFLDFARRHGGLEQLRLLRQMGANGTGQVHLSSTLSAGRVRVREKPNMSSSARHSSRKLGA